MSVSRSIAWMGAAQGIGLLLQFASQVVLARFLTPQEVGIFAVALATISTLSLLQALGLQALIVREQELTAELAASTFTINALFAVFLAAMVLVIGRIGASFLGDPAVGTVLTALALTPIIGAFSFLPLAMLEREGQFRAIAVVNSAGNIAAAIATIVLATSGFSYMSAAYAQWVNAIVLVIAALLLARGHASVRLSFRAWRRIARFGVQMLAINGISAVSLRLSDVILPRFLGLGSLGIYSRASGLNGLMWMNAHLFIGRVMLVDFVALVRQAVSLRKRYMSTVDLVTAVLWPVFGGFAVISGPFILIVFGERWLPATVPLALLLLSSMIQLAISMTWELFTATGQLSRQARIEFIRAIGGFVLFIVGCSISLEAAAAARVGDAVIAFILYRPHLNRMTDTSSRDFWPIYTRNALLTFVAIGPAAIVMQAYDWRADASLILLLPAVATGALLWVGALMLVRHPVITEARQLLPRRWQG